MKTAIYIEDGRTQFVLTPETKIDKEVLAELQSTNLKTYRGSFYGCQGGWTRHEAPLYYGSGLREQEDQSLIFVIEKPQPASTLHPTDVKALADGCGVQTS
jgi:hypothetical protein